MLPLDLTINESVRLFSCCISAAIAPPPLLVPLLLPTSPRLVLSHSHHHIPSSRLYNSHNTLSPSPLPCSSGITRGPHRAQPAHSHTHCPPPFATPFEELERLPPPPPNPLRLPPFGPNPLLSAALALARSSRPPTKSTAALSCHCLSTTAPRQPRNPTRSAVVPPPSCPLLTNGGRRSRLRRQDGRGRGGCPSLQSPHDAALEPRRVPRGWRALLNTKSTLSPPFAKTTSLPPAL